MKILCCDTDPANLSYLRNLFRRRFGVPVLSAQGSSEAIKYLLQNRDIHLVLCDLNLNEGGGDKLWNHLRRNNSDIPFIWMCQQKDKKNKVVSHSLIESPINQFLSKPLNEIGLVSVVEIQISGREKKYKKKLLPTPEEKAAFLEAYAEIDNSPQDANPITELVNEEEADWDLVKKQLEDQAADWKKEKKKTAAGGLDDRDLRREDAGEEDAAWDNLKKKKTEEPSGVDMVEEGKSWREELLDAGREKRNNSPVKMEYDLGDDSDWENLKSNLTEDLPKKEADHGQVDWKKEDRAQAGEVDWQKEEKKTAGEVDWGQDDVTEQAVDWVQEAIKKKREESGVDETYPETANYKEEAYGAKKKQREELEDSGDNESFVAEAVSKMKEENLEKAAAREIPPPEFSEAEDQVDEAWHEQEEPVAKESLSEVAAKWDKFKEAQSGEVRPASSQIVDLARAWENLKQERGEINPNESHLPGKSTLKVSEQRIGRAFDTLAYDPITWDESLSKEEIFDASGYVNEPVGKFFHYNVMVCDLYIRLSGKKILKIVNKEEFFEGSRLKKYVEKGVTHFYFHEDDHSVFQERHGNYLRGKALTRNFKNQNRILPRSLTTELFDQLMRFGLNKDNINDCQIVLNESLELVRANEKLLAKFEQLANNRNNTLEHSILLAYIALHLCFKHDWSAETTLQEVCLGCLFHDIELPDPRLALVEDLEDPKADHLDLGKELVKGYDKHPILGANHFDIDSELFPHVGLMIKQHHEKPDGSGFPEGLTHSEIHPLSALLIVCEDFTRQIFGVPQNQIFLHEIHHKLKQKYEHHGTFGKIYEAIIETFKP